jgi:hypothetical protein
MRKLIALVAVAMLGQGCLYFFDWDVTLSGSSSGAGGSTPCKPGAVAACYGGPAGTEGVGLCKAGARACAADGMGWGPCTGEVLPQMEDCASGKDQDCDGVATACGGSLVWAERFGGALDQYGRGIALDGAGNVLVTGDGYGLDFGGGPLTDTSLFVAKLDPAGHHVWSRGFGDQATVTRWGAGVALDASGNVFLTGYFGGTVDFGGGPLVSAGSDDIFIAKLDASGKHLWSRRFGAAGNHQGQSVAVDGLGNVIVAGRFDGAVDFGGGALVSAGGFDLFVAKLDGAGNHRWSRSFGDAAYQFDASVAVDTAGSVIVAGDFLGSIDLGGGKFVSAGGNDVFVAKLDAMTGDHIWSKSFGDQADQRVTGVATDAAGHVLVTGNFSGAIDFGGSVLTSAGSGDIFIAKLDPNGNHEWSDRFGGTALDSGQAIAADAAGNVLVTGSFKGTADLEDGGVTSAGGSDIFVVKVQGVDGSQLWSKHFGGLDTQTGQSITADAAGNVFVTGYMAGTVDFGSGPLMSGGGLDIFVVKLNP